MTSHGFEQWNARRNLVRQMVSLSTLVSGSVAIVHFDTHIYAGRAGAGLGTLTCKSIKLGDWF